MKQWIRILCAVMLLTLCVACAKQEETPVTPEEDSKEETVVPEESTSPEESTAPETTDASVLVIYFSRTGEQYNVGVIDKGNTAIVAEMIAEETGADLFEVLPQDDYYPMTYNELTEVAQQEQRDKARPAYQGELSLNKYDTIFIGAPVWWGDWPMIMYTVFENNDFSGKTLIPFNTHEGSGLSGFDKKLQNACPDSTLLKAFSTRGQNTQNDSESVKKDVQSWLGEIGF